MLATKRLTALTAPVMRAGGPGQAKGLAMVARRRLPLCSATPAPPTPSRSPSCSSTHLRSFAPTSRFSHSQPEAAELPTETTFTEEEYEHVSEADMETMYANLENLCEQFGPEDWEVELSSGVMTLSVPPTGTYVINKQPPNLQIWMSSPVSGPSRFEYVDGKWVHHRQAGVKLGELLDVELRGILKDAGREGEGWDGVGLP